MRYAAILTLLLLPACLCAQEPKPPVDALVEQITGIRAKRAELDKAESAALAALRAELKRQSDLIERLGIDGPKPPKPVDPPDIVPPKPVDPLRAKLKAAFDLSAGGTGEKSEWAKDLAALYRAASKLVADPTLTTAAQLRSKLKDASAALIGAESLLDVRKAVAVELAAVLPTTDGDLTDAQRASAAALFKRLAEILETIGG